MGLIKTVWIDDDYFNSNFPLPSNIERKNLSSTIKMSQSTRLYDLLGSCLYEDLEAKIIAQTLTADEQELVDMCKQLLVYYTATELIEFVRSEKGLTSTEEGRDPLSQSASNKASYWELRIVRFIKSVQAIYDLATADGCTDFDAFNEEQSNAASGMYYPRTGSVDGGDCEYGIYLKNY